MDVRCERCQTEYELEDDSVTEAGTQVQCTSCNHTFVVRKGAGGAAPSAVIEDGPNAAEWLLETADGQSHRFRSLTSLQKWIIERKVTRFDKISKTGHAWRRLGEIVELSPFFDVVDEADRAKAGAAEAARDLKLEAARVRSGAGRPTPKRGEPAAREAALPRETEIVPRAAGRSSEILPVEAPVPGADIETSVVRLAGGGFWKVLAGLAVAGGVAYMGITRFLPEHVARLETSTGEPASEARPGTEPSPAVEAPPVPPTAPSGTEAAPANPQPAADETAQANSPPGGSPSAGATPPAPGAAANPSPSSGAPAAAARAAAKAQAKAATKAAAPSAEPDRSYDQLVTEADRLLENGGTSRAAKLYDRALEQRRGPEALAGLGYVALDRGRSDLAVAHFRRALALAPYGPAVFGLGEAYRAQGKLDQALEQYQRYLSISPNGSDAPAARRQVSSLGKRGDSPGPANPAAPAEGTPPPPASVLQEGAH